jgi:hypothetical protein
VFTSSPILVPNVLERTNPSVTKKERDTQAYSSWCKLEEKKKTNVKIRLMKWKTKTPSHFFYMNLEQLLSNLRHYHGWDQIASSLLLS